MEAIWGFRASGEALLARVAFENPEVIETYKAAGTTLVLLTAHTCNWEWLLLASGVRFDFPIDAVYKRLALKGVDDYVREARSRFGGNPIPFETFLFELMRRPPQPRAYAMVADQTPKKKMPKYWTRFLGRETAFYLGPEKIARYLDAPVLYVEMTRVRVGYYSVRFHVLAEPPYDEDSGPADRRALCAQARGDGARASGGLALGPQQMEVRSRSERDLVEGDSASDVTMPQASTSVMRAVAVERIG